MEILLEDLDELEKDIQKFSVIDKEKYSYFSQEIQEIRNKLIELENTKPVILQQEVDKIISNINRLRLEFSNYMQTGNIEKMPGKLFFELPEQENSEISGNEKIKRHRLGLLASTVELVKKDVQLDFTKVEQAITKFNSEKNSTDPEYSTVEIAYIDKLIAELFIEYQRKYYKENGTLPFEDPSNYCNMDTYERLIRVMTSEKLIEEKERISRIEGLILDGKVVNSNEIWNMLSGGAKGKEGVTTSLVPVNKQNRNLSNQLISVKARNKINNKLVLTIRVKNIFGNLVDKTKSIKLNIDGWISIPNKMKPNIIRAILPEGISIINKEAFQGCVSLSEVFIPDSVNEIRDSAFYDCRSLKNIELPENITYLGWKCFSNSGLFSINIPQSVREISPRAFYNCSNLNQVILQEGLKEIGTEAFFSSGIETIRIPDSVETIGDDSLYCPYLEQISLPKNLKNININSISGNKHTEIIIRGQDVVLDNSKNSTSDGIIIERE